MEELRRRFFYDLVMRGEPHKYHQRNTENTELYTALVSGDGLDKYMKQFHQREDDVMFKQRKDLTNHICHSVCKNVRDVEYKVPRSNSITKAILGSNETKIKDLKDILKKFWGRYSFDDWMSLRWIELNDTDPNAFVVIDWKEFEPTEYAQPYPYEVSSENTYDFQYVNNILQYLIERKVRSLETEELSTFTIWDENETIRLSQMSQEEAKDLLGYIYDKKEKIQEISLGDVLYVYIDEVFYLVSQFEPHNLDAVPAYQVGYVRDVATKGKTFLPPWWASIPILKNLINAKSELDLAEALHTFPQKVQYVNRCRNKMCNEGRLPDDKVCPKCNGLGYEVHTTGQDTILLPMPKDKEEMLDLEKIMHYFYPPTELLEHMDKYVDKLSRRCMQLVYNSEIYSREMIAETATGRNIDLQAVYDTLYPMVKEMAMDWEWGVTMVAKITDLDEGITAQFTFSKDFKLKSVDQYYEDLKTVTESDASFFIKSSIEDDIARLIYSDDKMAYARYNTLRRFNPFLGDSQEMIMVKISKGGIATNFNKVLYTNYKAIFDDLERENKTFWILSADKQWDLIQAKVEEYQKILEKEKPKVPTFGLPKEKEEEEPPEE